MQCFLRQSQQFMNEEIHKHTTNTNMYRICTHIALYVNIRYSKYLDRRTNVYRCRSPELCQNEFNTKDGHENLQRKDTIFVNITYKTYKPCIYFKNIILNTFKEK